MARVKYVAMAAGGAAAQGVRWKNAALAAGLVGFVGSVYFFTYGKMKTVSRRGDTRRAVSSAANETARRVTRPTCVRTARDVCGLASVGSRLRRPPPA